MLDPYLALYIYTEHFDECLKRGITHRAETRRGEFFNHFLLHPNKNFTSWFSKPIKFSPKFSLAVGTDCLSLVKNPRVAPVLVVTL